MRLAEACAADAPLADLTLTEAYITIGLVKRKVPKTEVAETTAPSTVLPLSPFPVISSSPDLEAILPATPATRRVGKSELIRRQDAYLLEVAEDWQTVLFDILADIDNFEDVLKDGLLIRFKPQPQSAAGQNVTESEG